MKNLKYMPFALALGATGLAQEATPNLSEVLTEEALVASLSRVLFDQPAEGVLHARGASWKAHFSTAGASYVPFLGADAPRNFPVRFRLESATVGGQALALAATPSVRREGDRVILDHGSLLEIYDLSVDSIEQSFVLPRRSRGGEVRVRMAIDSELVGQAQGRGLRFAGEQGSVNYGEAFAFDPTGRRADVTSRLDGSHLELIVPDAFPLEGEGELVIDPVISTDIASGGGLQVARNADVAFEKDVDGGVYMLVYELSMSASDTDVYSAEVVKSTGQIRNVEAIDLSSDDWRSPRVAGNDSGNAFMFVAEVEPAGGSAFTDIIARLRVAGNSIVSPPRFVNTNPGFQICRTPDIGGESVVAAGIWCIVYQEDVGSSIAIRAQAMTGTGSVLGFPIFLSPGGVEDSQPTISESSGANGSTDYRFNVAWTRQNGPNDRDVWAAQIEPSFSGVSTVTSGFKVSSLGDQHSPAVSSLSDTPLSSTGTRPWLIACVQEGSQDSDVIVHALSGSTAYGFHSMKTMENDLFPGSYGSSSIGCVGDAFVLTYSSSSFSGAENVFMNTIYTPVTTNGMTLALAERRQEAGMTNNADYVMPSLVTDWESGDLASDEGMIGHHGNFALGVKSVYATQFEAYNSPAIGTQYCEANFNSVQANGWLALYGDQNAGATHIAFSQDLPPGVPCMMIAGMNPAVINMPGGSMGTLCVGGAVRVASTLTSTLFNGTAVQLLDSSNLPGQGGSTAVLPGETWHYQVWHRDNVGGSTSNFTNAVRVQYQ